MAATLTILLSPLCSELGFPCFSPCRMYLCISSRRGHARAVSHAQPPQAARLSRWRGRRHRHLTISLIQGRMPPRLTHAPGSEQQPATDATLTRRPLQSRFHVLGYPPGPISERSELGAASGHLVPEISGFTALDCPRRRIHGPRLVTTTQGGQTCRKKSAEAP